MEVATSDKGGPQRNGLHSEQGIKNRRSRGVAGYAGRESGDGDRTLHLIVDFLAGLFAFWLSLTVLGLIGLSDILHQGLSLSLRIIVSSGVALMVCMISFPLFVPWFAVFVAAISVAAKEILSVEVVVMHDSGLFVRYWSFVDRRVGLLSSDFRAIDFSEFSSSDISFHTCGGPWRDPLPSRSDD